MAMMTNTSSPYSGTDSNYYLKDFWNEGCDPRSVQLWLMADGPWKLLGFTFAYILIVIVGKKLMKYSKPYELRTPMLVYNTVMVFINAYFLYQSLKWIKFGTRLTEFHFPSPYDRSEESMNIVNMFYLYQWTKFVDYFDTFFFILRKKERQLTILHIYHHISVPIIGWVSSWLSPTMPVLGLFAMLNCFCHVIMYSYYALSSFGSKIQPYLWWKKYITQIQLTQFAIIGFYGLCLNSFHVNYPLFFRMLPVSQAIIFISMFGNFYIRSYMKRSNSSCVKKEE